MTTPDCPSENALLAYVSGETAERASLEAHFAGCERCRVAIVALVSATLPKRQGGSLARGATIDRYVIIDLVGAGAMGQVYAAYDPVLDRRVALKLLHRLIEGIDARARLLREAKALARVAHPNLVGVHDAGSFEDSVFIAMEFVEGQTLRGWLAAQKRSADEVLDAFRQAGRGLAAAHAAGLVHRDFKPENVLVGKDGRVRVSDFGLAREANEAHAPTTSPTEPGDGLQTATGALVGTPAYMAPEQLAGQTADARADQFAFAVALYEALDGKRPFERNTKELVSKGPPRAVTPAQAQRALTRALSAEPSARFGAIDELLEALAPEGVRRWPLVVGALAVAATVAIAVTQTTSTPCSTGAARVSAAWNDSRRASLAKHFDELGGAPVFTSISRAVDEYGAGWATMHREACEATRVRGEQSDQVLTVRMACLDRRLGELEGVLGVLATTNAAALPRVSDSLNALTPLAVCANTQALLAPLPRPEQPAVLERVATIERELVQAQALNEAGRFAEGIPLARTTTLEAHDVGWLPLEADTLLALGTLTHGGGKNTDAEPMLRDAFARAVEARSDRLAVTAAVTLSFLYNELGRLKEAQEWVWLASSLLKRVGEDLDLEARVANQEGHLLSTQGDYRGAEVKYRRAWELRKRLQGELHPRTILMWANVGMSVGGQGRAAEAIPILRAVAAQLEQTLGRAHYKVGQAHYGVGEQLLAAHRAQEAFDELSAILPIQEKALGLESPHVGRLWMLQGHALVELGRFDEAIASEQRALESFRGSKTALMEAVSTRLLGRAQCGAGRHDEAAKAFGTARQQFAAIFDEHHDEVLSTNEAEAACLLRQGQPEKALTLFEQVVAERLKATGPDDPWNASAIAGLGRAQLASGKKALGRETLTKAAALLEATKFDDVALKEVREALEAAR